MKIKITLKLTCSLLLQVLQKPEFKHKIFYCCIMIVMKKFSDGIVSIVHLYLIQKRRTDLINGIKKSNVNYDCNTVQNSVKNNRSLS